MYGIEINMHAKKASIISGINAVYIESVHAEPHFVKFFLNQQVIGILWELLLLLYAQETTDVWVSYVL